MPPSTGCDRKTSAYPHPAANSSLTKTVASTAAYAPASAPPKPSASTPNPLNSPSRDRAASSANNAFPPVPSKPFPPTCRPPPGPMPTEWIAQNPAFLTALPAPRTHPPVPQFPEDRLTKPAHGPSSGFSPTPTNHSIPPNRGAFAP